MTDREQLAKLVEDIRQLFAKIEQANKDGAAADVVAQLHERARAKVVALGDLHETLLDAP